MNPCDQAATPWPDKSNRSVDQAEAIAIEALSFLATDTDRLARFLTLCGLTPQGLRAAAATPGFLAAVLDHVTADASLLLSFAANAGREPPDIDRARQVLAGAEPWNSV